MWKKLLVSLLAFIGIFSVAYAMNHEMHAYTGYHAGGNVTGRLGNHSGGNFQKGDRIITGIKNLKDQSDMSWQFLSEPESYTDYGCNTGAICNNTKTIGQLVFAQDSIGSAAFGITKNDFKYCKTYSGTNKSCFAAFTDSPIYKNNLLPLNQSIKGNNRKIINFRNFTHLREFATGSASSTWSIMPSTFNNDITVQDNVFLPFIVTSGRSDALVYDREDEFSSLNKRDLQFTSDYWGHITQSVMNLSGEDISSIYFSNYYIRSDGRGQYYGAGGTPTPETAINANVVKDIRPAFMVKVEDIVFAVSQGTNEGIARIEQYTLDSNYTDIRDAQGAQMKIRLYDASLKATLLDLQNIHKDSTTKFVSNQDIVILAEASIGGGDGVNTLSVLLFDENGKFIMYQPLESAKGKGEYAFTLPTLEKGNYSIGIVNEDYAENNSSPASCSSLSSLISFEIVKELNGLEVTERTNLEYQKNVNQNDIVAELSSQDGVLPIQYKIQSDTSFAGHSNDYSKFKVGKDENGISVIQITEADGLEAGTYHFKIQAQDANGDPTTPLEISASITVAKTNPDLKFTTTNTIDKVVGGSSFTESFTHKNTDTSDASFKLTYSSLIPDVATVDTPTGNTDTDIEITPGATNGSTTITVNLAETKNFKSANATLTVNVHPKISLSFTPDKNSFAVNEVASAGTKIGSVSLTGNSPQYEYTMALDPTDTDAGANNALFDVKTTGKTNATSMDIITKFPNIPQGTYKITIKAEDAYGQIAYAKGTITIAGMAQTGFAFYDYQNASKVMTNDTLTIYYGEDSAKLVTKGGQTSGLTYAPDDSAQTVLTINPSDGTLVTNNIGKVKVKATKPADGTYSEAVIYMFVEVKACEQEINFDKTGNTTISYDNTNGNSFSETATGKIKTGMPNAGEAGFGKIEYSLGGTDKGIASISSTTGEITINARQNITTMKTFTVTVKLNDGNTKNPKYGSASATKTVNVYPPGSASWTQTNKPQADNNAGTEKIGDLTVTGGSGNAKFSISSSGDVGNLDKEFFDIHSTSGEVTLIKQITVADIASKTYNPTEKAYEMHVMVDINDGGNTTTEHLTIYIKGAERLNLDFKNRDTVTQEITETYDVNKSFNLSLNQNISGTTYRISTNPNHTSPNDVITVSTSGKADIQNANEAPIAGSTTSPVYVEAIVPPSAGYKEMIIEAPVRIKRASQTLSFSQNPINTSADIQSLTITMSGHKDGNNLIYNSNDTKVKVIADPANSDSFTIKPNAVVKNGIIITAIAQGDRNYKDDLKTATLNIAQAGKNQFTATFPSMTYGDSGPFEVVILPAGSGNETYRYTVADTNIVEIDANGNITPHHAGTTTVDVTQTSTGGTVGPYTFTITVNPKPITVTIEDKTKYTGMDMPAFTVDIPSADVVAGDMIPIPEFRCVDTNGFDVDANTGAGSYPITGTYPNPPSDYDITIVEGKLAVSQDNGSQSWYELQDISGNKTSSSVWHKDAVEVVLKPATGSAGTYDQIANDTSFSNQDLTRFTVSDEGETTQDIYFRIDPNGSVNKGALTLPIQETIRIDNTEPVITSIVGKNAPNSKLRALLNTLTFGKFFKQGMIITIHAEDVEPQPGVVVSGIQKITYTINKVDGQGNPIGTPNTVNQSDETVEVSIQEAGNYKVCAKATDQAGNEGSNTCEEFDIRKIDVDVDKDGKPDFNDPDENGCADFNIVYKDEETGNWKILNVDANRDGIPEMNIDTNGDGKPNINVDSDNDGRPDLNLVIMTKELWKPTQCVIQHGEQYESGMDITPQINVDTTGNGIPNINIDTDGDFKADFNIDTDGDGKPDLNIGKVHEKWEPKKDDCKKDDFFFDTATDGKPLINIDSNKDGYPDINVDLDGDGKADINIDIDGDGIPDIDIDGNGDGKPNINVDTTGDGKPDESIIEITEWNPEKIIDGDVPYGTMEIKGISEIEDNGIIVEKPSGEFLPNSAIKVKDISDEIDASIKSQLDKIAKDQEVKKVYDVEYLENDTAKQPDGKVNVKIPIDPLIKNAKVVIEKEDGSFEEVSYTEKDGYYVFETEYIGKVSVIGDAQEEPEPTPDPEPTTDPSPTPTKPSTSVKGNYTNSNQMGTKSGMGGAYTGDVINSRFYVWIGCLSITTIMMAIYVRYKKGRS